MNTLTVLDDDDIFHKIMDYAHAKSDFYTHIYHDYSAEQLLDYLYEHSDESERLPDVLFVDIYLPAFDGWSFLDAYDKLVDMLCKKIAVYIVTTSVRKEDAVRGNEYPFVVEYLTKPLTTDKLREIARNVRIAS